MGSRERKRAARRKRIERATGRDTQVPEETVSLAEDDVSASEAKNRAVRDSLDPLDEGERPLVVTIGAVVSALVAIATVAGYAAGVEVPVYENQVEVGEERPPVATVIAGAGIFAVMAWGMWGARYWAVLGFQAICAISLLIATVNLVTATDALDIVSLLLVIGVAGAFFWFGVKAMARIQMPERP